MRKIAIYALLLLLICTDAFALGGTSGTGTGTSLTGGSCLTASTSVSGCVKVDGSTITISNGVISGVASGSGTVNSGTTPDLSYYASSTTAVSDAPGLQFNVTTHGLNINGVTALFLPDNELDLTSVAVGPGAFALGATTTMNSVAVGLNALAAVTTGTKNTAVGSSAGNAIVTNSGLTAIGYNAGLLITAGNNTVIGNAVASTTLTTGTNDVFIGTDSTTGAPLSSTTSAIAIGTGAKAGSTDTAIGIGALNASTVNSNGNTAIGYQALNLETTGATTAVGYQALSKVTTSPANTALGYQALLNLTTSFGDNTAIGYLALTSLSTGWNNSALGALALTTATTGHQNMAFGTQALEFLSTGNQDVGIGNGAGCAVTTGSNNTFLGHLTGVGSNSCVTAGVAITGSNNTGIGSFALSIVQGAAAGNTTIGQSTGVLITTGSSNTILGNAVGSTTLTTGGTNILIGVNNAITTAASGTNDTINIGGTGGSWVLVTGTNTNTTANTIAHGVWNMPDLTQTSVAQTGTVCSGTAGILTVDTTVACLASLEELKDKHGNITNALGTLMKLNPFWFTWKTDTPEYAGDKYEQPGLGAHQVESVDKRLVGYTPNGKLKGVRYQSMVALLVEAIKEQQAEIDDLKARLK